MAGDDELERLLREVDATLGNKPAPQGQVAKRPEAQPPGRVGRGLRSGLVAGAVCGVTMFTADFFLSILPGDQHPISVGSGAFFGGLITGFWFTIRGRD